MTMGSLPTVTWGEYEISRLIVGHNPLKGHSHGSAKMGIEMKDYFKDRAKGVELVKLCYEQGVNTAQFGRGTFDILSTAYDDGFALKWIATLYNDPGGRRGSGNHEPKTVDEELERFESVRAPLIGYQHFGESTDHAYFNGKLNDVRRMIDRLRDHAPKRLVGVCTHLPEVVRTVNQERWPVDFLQTSLYTVYADSNRRIIDRTTERFNLDDRERMIEAITHTEIPCIVFKVLGSRRQCETPEQVREALAYALNNIKSKDVVCVGMWQKYRDQVADNARFIREILAENGVMTG